MKTRKDFVLLVDAYRTEVRRRFLFFLPLMLIVGAGLIIVEMQAGHSPLIQITTRIFPFLCLAFVFYQLKSRQSMARKLGLDCPSCAHAFTTREMSGVVSTRNCPACGAQVFA